jgi:hypothetical protein
MDLRSPLGGSGRMKVDNEIVELDEWDAVRVPPGTWRGYEAGPEGLETAKCVGRHAAGSASMSTSSYKSV